MNLLEDDSPGINLLADNAPEATPAPGNRSFYDLSKADQMKALDLARQQISEQYPNMPNWLRDLMLTITPKDQSPRLARVAQELQGGTNFIPSAVGGLLQGASLPMRGIASFIPGKVAEDFVNAPNYEGMFPAPMTGSDKAIQNLSEFTGSLGGLGKLFSGLKYATQAAKVPKVLQNALALTGTGAIATPGDVRDKILGATGSLALGGAGKLAGMTASKIAEKVPAFLRGLTNDSTLESLAQAVQKPHDIMSNTASKLYDFVKKSINQRNLSIPVKQQYLDDARAMLPNTRASEQLINKASNGDYSGVHDLQSQLYKKGTKALTSDDVAINNQGEEILDLRNKINDDLRSHLIQNGHADIAHVLDQARDVHKNLMQTYFNPNLPKSIGKLVHSDTRLIPENLATVFDQNSVPMKRFLQKHPDVSKEARGVQEKEAAKKALGKIFSGTAKIGGTAYVGKSLFDLLK
jgi:hypothetical protein